jgi:glycerol uptake facilitator protein
LPNKSLNKKSNKKFPGRAFFGEFLGTFVMMLFGTGAGAVSVVYGSYSGQLQTALIWGIAVALAIYMTRALSDAHLNPVFSVAHVIAGTLPLRRLKWYILAQFCGSILAALIVYLLFAPQIAVFETAHNITRGTFESVETARIFGDYYNTPVNTAQNIHITMLRACVTEVFSTFMLVLSVFFLTDKRNLGGAPAGGSPLIIGLLVTSVICFAAPITGAGLNPARDFGPRIITMLFGWKEWAFPDAQGGFFWVYILSPIIGGSTAALVYRIRKDAGER